VLAVGPRGDSRERLRALAGAVADAHRSLDGPAGNGLRAHDSKLNAAWPPRAKQMKDVLNTAELASLWHLPESGDSVRGVRRTRARRLAPPPSHAVRGARVGAEQSSRTPVLMPEPLLHRNQLIVAKTRRGKSTLLRHIAADLMERMLHDPDGAALVVVDPHQDLAEAVLRAVPAGLDDRVVYLDMAHRDRPVGLNLLDVALFPDRDRATEHVITIMHRLWPDSWGPRMEGALRASVASLMELNRSLPRERQYTLLDVAALLSNADFRADVLEQVHDPALQAWWRDNYNRLNRTLQQQIATPVTTKIGRFVVTEASRLVLGQARSTFDPRMTLREGGVLVINTAAGSLGEGASALVGATLLNLIGLMVEEQVELPPEQRRRIVVLVDESSTLGAVDYSRMLSELVKYGASFVLVTQGLAKLDAVDRSLVPTIFSNIDGLTVFQVSADDARRLTPELGGDLEVEDLTGLDDFECYARWWDGAARPAAFSFRVDPPPADTRDRMEVIAERSARRFGRPRATVATEVALALEAQRSTPAAPAGGERKQASPDELAATVEQTTAPGRRQDPPADQPVERRRSRTKKRRGAAS
jgi:type IV secretion system coupling TraD/TrwB family protein